MLHSCLTHVSKLVCLSCCMPTAALSHSVPHTPVGFMGCCSAYHAVSTTEDAIFCSIWLVSLNNTIITPIIYFQFILPASFSIKALSFLPGSTDLNLRCSLFLQHWPHSVFSPAQWIHASVICYCNSCFCLTIWPLSHALKFLLYFLQLHINSSYQTTYKSAISWSPWE